MINLSFRYDHSSARLRVDGLPDTSLGHKGETIGIISSWRLQLIASPELEGKLDHLQAMMRIVVPYARYRLSGVAKTFGEDSSSASISPSAERGHQLFLRSSQQGTEPLKIFLDDAELSDLVRCFDCLRFDPRVSIDWDIPKDHPLPVKDLVQQMTFSQRFGASFFGVLTFLTAAFIAFLVPVPEPFFEGSSTPSSTELLEKD